MGGVVRNGRFAASVCLMVVLVLGMLAGQSTALWSCMGRCLLKCFSPDPSAVFCAARCYSRCHHPDYIDHDDHLLHEYYCKLDCVTDHHQCSNINILPPLIGINIPPPSQNHAAAGDEGTEKMEGYCASCFSDCEKKKH